MGEGTVHSAIEWLQILSLGGLIGMLGQGARIAVGIKKLSDEATAKNTATSALVEPARLLISLLIGFIAGALAAVSSVTAASQVSTQQVLALAGAGYAGADFIEGAMSTFQKSSGGTSSANTQTTQAASSQPSSAETALG